MDMMTVFDGIILLFGIYMIGSGFKMKRTKEPNSVVVAKEELAKCKDKAGMAEFFYWREIVFGIILAITGILGVVNDLWINLGVLNIVEMVVFLAAFVWIQSGLRKAREKFFGAFR